MGNSVLIVMASAALVLSEYNGPGQSPDDSAARARLAEEITQKYGLRVSGDLSLTQLYVIVAGLNEICSIARQDHVSLEAAAEGNSTRWRPAWQWRIELTSNTVRVLIGENTTLSNSSG